MDYIQRRKNVINEMKENSIFVFFNVRPFEDASKYDVDRNFYYLTGLLEFDNILVLKKGKEISEKLYIHRIDLQQEKWTGKTIRKDEAIKISGIQNIDYIDNFYADLTKMVEADTCLYTLFKEDDSLNYSYEEVFRKKVQTDFNLTLINGNNILKKYRSIKDNEEVELIRKANLITNEGLKEILSNLKPGLLEYQVESYFDQAIKFNGATGYSFPTIAASGINGTCLHYSENNSIINDGDLILFDLGASLNTYCADISRTYPANGKFTERQKLVYNIVLNGQKLIESKAKPGYTTRELNQILVDYFYDELKKIGLVNTKEEVFKYYFHGVSHHLGMDCHDFCIYDSLKPGAVISNEPGLYIPEWNIGIRIEDDLLITENGNINLSAGVIKEIDEIEDFMSR